MTLEIKRVVYGKESTPVEDREYIIEGVPGCPVGTLKNWQDFIKDKKQYTGVEIVF